MALNKSLKKVLILGSGPIIIGQAAEFDYSGTQACKAVKEEGIETILVNSNPATIMTDDHMADKVYIEPLTMEAVEQIISQERPDGIMAGFGGQTALNLAMKLNEEGILDKYGVKLLGINAEAIKKAEDREEFKKLMMETSQPVPMSTIATTISECMEFVKESGYPVIIRPAYTLGGSGGGIAENEEQFLEICHKGLQMSPIGQILIEQSVAGWKEIEYEVIRDGKDNCIIICNMENMDPVGIHTGDSIVVAPSQTLRDREYHMLRKAAVDIIRSLKIEGGCNIQYALDPNSERYIVIEVNPRVSRSSALASKATGYPIAKISAKIALGYSLDELKNYVTGTSSACFEPSLDYVVTKIPKWPFDKFSSASRTLGTQMKATGEVMAIGRSFESSLLKAVLSLDAKFTGLRISKMADMSIEELTEKMKLKDDQRMFAIAEAMRKGMSVESIHDLTKIDIWFLNAINNIVEMENRIKNEEITVELLREAKEMGISNEDMCELSGINVEKLERMEEENEIIPVYKVVDTCSGEFDAQTPYYYSCYEDEDENVISDRKKVVVIGSGPIRIGQGVEFDYCCVHGAWALKEAGYEAIMINNNPETVSTDFDTADKLYFEPLDIEHVMNIIRREKPEGVVVQLGGQTAINLAGELSRRGIKILGSSFESIDLAEDRDKFRNLLEELEIPSPSGAAVTSLQEGLEVVKKLGYPVVVRPSYVIGGRAMEVVHDEKGFVTYMTRAVQLSSEHPVLIDRYVKGTEIEVDAISDGEDILMPGIMEHIERTGVHSGDSITVYPYVTLGEEVIRTLQDYTARIARKLKVVGLMNVQYVFDGSNVYVIEVNPRASRTVPILSKVTGVPMVKLATEILLGKKLTEMQYGTGLMKNKGFHAVKVPVFSNEKLIDADIYLGPEMKSTGEVLGVDKNLNKAIYKGFCASGINMVSQGSMYVSLNDVDKTECLKVIRKYVNKGFSLHASEGSAQFLKENDLECSIMNAEDVLAMIPTGKMNLIINTPTRGNDPDTDGFKLRRRAAEYRIPLFTCIDTARVYLNAISEKGREIKYSTMKEHAEN